MFCLDIGEPSLLKITSNQLLIMVKSLVTYIYLMFCWIMYEMKGKTITLPLQLLKFWCQVCYCSEVLLLTTSYPPGLSWPSHGPEVARLLRICHEPLPEPRPRFSWTRTRIPGLLCCTTLTRSDEFSDDSHDRKMRGLWEMFDRKPLS